MAHWWPEVAIEARRRLATQGAHVIRETCPDLDIEAVGRAGLPAAVLVDASRTADLLIVGTRGLNSLAEMALGSVAERVAAHGQCPVVVVHGDMAVHPGPGHPVVVGVDDSAGARRAVDVAGARAHDAGGWPGGHPPGRRHRPRGPAAGSSWVGAAADCPPGWARISSLRRHPPTASSLGGLRSPQGACPPAMWSYTASTSPPTGCLTVMVVGELWVVEFGEQSGQVRQSLDAGQGRACVVDDGGYHLLGEREPLLAPLLTAAPADGGQGYPVGRDRAAEYAGHVQRVGVAESGLWQIRAEVGPDRVRAGR